jgi:hypothetical protein
VVVVVVVVVVVAVVAVVVALLLLLMVLLLQTMVSAVVAVVRAVEAPASAMVFTRLSPLLHMQQRSASHTLQHQRVAVEGTRCCPRCSCTR